jgi:hypothetical protein
MNTLISCCGLDCADCGARKATLLNDDELRKQTAEEWSKQFGADIPYQIINCTGCREEGVKFVHCNECEVRNCVNGKGYDTCADCAELESCSIVGGIHQHAPFALENLKALQK